MEEELERSSGDEAPEDISLSQSKSNAHERRRMENEAIKQQKDARKEARRKRQSKLIEQKKAKKTRTLERLPDEIIEILSSVDQQRDKLKDMASISIESSKIELSSEDTNRSTASKKTRQDRMKTKHRPTGNKKSGKVRGVQNLRVCVLNERYKPGESKAKKGRIFLREQLYGDRIKRVDSISARSAKAIGNARPKVDF